MLLALALITHALVAGAAAPAASPPAAEPVARKGPVIGLLKPSDEISDCGCYFDRGKQETVDAQPLVQWGIGDGAELARMRIDGRKVMLKVEDLNPSSESVPQLGAPEHYRLTAKDVNVDIRAAATKVCAADDEFCESTELQARITVETPAGRSEIDAHGVCGC